MDISFEKKSVSWEGIEILMRDFNKLRKWNISKMEMNAITIMQGSRKTFVTQEATDRMIKILDSNYQKANLTTVVEGAKHLTDEERT